MNFTSAKSGILYLSKMTHKHILQLRQTDRVRFRVKRFERMGNWQKSAQLQLWAIVCFAMRKYIQIQKILN